MSQKTIDALMTNRLRLVPATAPMIDAELQSRDRLAAALDAAVPPDWPPAHHEIETLRFWRVQLSQPGAAGWWLFYVLLTDGVAPTLVGTVAFKGPPADGMVEIGYSIVPTWQRRGLATAAARALIESAWARGVEMIVARTLPQLEPSIRVLHKLGFAPSESGEPGVLAFVLRRARPDRVPNRVALS
jgi:RimJ/RimL family protein N-acetyltransferase